MNIGDHKAEYERCKKEMMVAEEETQCTYQKKKGIAAERKEAQIEKQEAEKYQKLKVRKCIISIHLSQSSSYNILTEFY